jgi:hypothetical protein
MIRRIAQKAAAAVLGPLGLELRRATVGRGYVGPHPPPMQSHHVENCEVLPSRADLLRRLPAGGVVAELGVDRGDFSEAILELNRPERLHLVDAWSSARFSDGYSHVADRFRQEIESGKVVLDRGLSVDVLQQVPDAYFDWVYIDTDHGYDVTLAELNLCARKVKPDGHIAGHDFAQASRTGVRYGVIPACHQFCTEQNWQLAFLTIEYASFSSFCLRRIPSAPASR